MVPARHRVVAVRRELPDTVTVTIEPVETVGSPAAPVPGQFNMLWTFGNSEVPISVSGTGTRDTQVVHTIRAVGSATSALCSVREGDVVGVRGPFGTGWDVGHATGSDVVVVAGGLGLAPLRPVIVALLAERRVFGEIALLVGARSPDVLLYGEEVLNWRARSDVRVEVSVDHARPGWWGDVGVVTKLLDVVRFDPARTAAFVAGPEIMMRFTAVALVDRGVAAHAIHVSLERNMKCAVAHCGRCQIGPTLVCRDGPVYSYDVAAPLLAVRGR
jgi:NAD(P)H-flavin reductase